MTEAEWLSSDDPARQLAWLLDGTQDGPHGVEHGRSQCVSNRKLRLFACACCRQVWHLLADERSRRAVEVAERYADGEATADDLGAARNGLRLARGGLDVAGRWVCLPGAREAATHAALRAHAYAPDALAQPAQAALLRDVIGNPSRPIGLRHLGDALCRRCNGAGTRPGVYPPEPCPACSCVTPAARGIARLAYDGRDFAALPVLSDALEEGGCGDGDLLGHLRGWERCPGLCRGGWHVLPDTDGGGKVRGVRCGRCDDGRGRIPLRGPHARGCWALDLILGRL